MSDDLCPGAHSFVGVMGRTIQLLGTNAPRHTLRRVAEVVHAVRWDFQDYGTCIFMLLNDSGGVDSATEWAGPVDGVITMDAATFHSAAVGQGSLGMALLTGNLRVKGIPAMSMSRFSGLLSPFLNSYRQACLELNGSGR